MNFTKEELDKERLIDIPGYEGLYKISNLGRVYSNYSNKFLKSVIDYGARKNNKKYPVLIVSLCKYKRVKNYKISILMLLSFIGPCPENMEVCHNDGDALNNRLNNLRYDTKKNNQKDRLKHGTDARGDNCATAKLSNSQALEIITKYKGPNRYTHEILAKEYNVSKSTITHLLSGHNWKYLEGR